MALILLAALVLGISAGLRAFTPLAAVSWAAALGWLTLGDSVLAFLGYRWTPYVFTALALVEYVTDQLPSTPSRKVPMQFGARLVSGAVSGLAVGIGGGAAVAGLVAGVIGAVIGTLGGAEARRRLALAFGRDLPAALLEDVAAILLALAAVGAFS